MNAGDRVKVIKLNSKHTDSEGTIVREYGNDVANAWWVQLDGVTGTSSFYSHQLEVIEDRHTVDPFAYVLSQRVEKNKPELIKNINEFRRAAADGNLGRFSTNGLISVLVSILVSGSDSV